MNAKTPFLNKTLFLKNITRFFPLWGGYLLCLLLGSTILPSKEDSFFLVTSVANLHDWMAPIGMGMAFLAVQALFGDLYDPRLCATLHAMPLERGVIYRTGVVSGLLFSLVPTAILSLLLIFPLSQVAVPNASLLALTLWVFVNGYYLFFFGAGVVCAMLAGNRLGQAALYGIVNLFGTLMYFLVDGVYAPLLYGFVTQDRPFTRLSPGIYGHIYNAVEVEYTWTHPVVDGAYTLPPEPWRYMLIVAVLGALLIFAGSRLYRRRDLEKAGDFLAWEALQPVVLVAISLCVGSAVPFLVRELFYRAARWLSYPFLAVGISVGWLAGKMLLERTVWVFRPKNFLGLGILAGVLAVSLGLTKLDVLNLEGRMPDPEKVASVSVTGGESDDPAFLEQVLDFHALALQNRVPSELVWESGGEDGVYYDTLHIIYKLKNGDDMMRVYTIPLDSPAGEAARKLLNHPSCVFNSLDGPDRFITEQDVRDFSNEPVSLLLGRDDLRVGSLTKEDVDRLLDALLADCRAGTMAQDPLYHPTAQWEGGGDYPMYLPLNLTVKKESPEAFPYGNTATLYLYIGLDSANTLAALEDMGISREMLLETWQKHPW